jgi:predicted transposase/invertase (TIGR01784 family)
MSTPENTNQTSLGAESADRTSDELPDTNPDIAPDRPTETNETIEANSENKRRPPVPLTSDFVFKYVFGAKNSTGILRSLLSAVQEDAGYPAVATVQITNPFNQKDYADDKLSVVDVKATDVTGATYSMEAQATYHAAFDSRALYYWARSYGNQLSESEIYSRLQPVVGINVLDFRLFPESSSAPMHTAFRAYCREAPQLAPLGDFIIHFIELPQFDHRDRMPSTGFGTWMYYIKYRGEEGVMDRPIMKTILEETSEIREAEKRYKEFVADAELRDRLEARDKARRTHLQLLHDAEKKGKAEGVEEGRAEERRETARKLKARDMSIAEIVQITALTEEEVRAL